jgi:hypothetical protein
MAGKSPTPDRMTPFHRASPEIPQSAKSSVTVKSVLSQAREEADVAPRASVGKPPRSSKKATPSSKMILAPIGGSQSPPAQSVTMESIPISEPN